MTETTRQTQARVATKVYQMWIEEDLGPADLILGITIALIEERSVALEEAETAVRYCTSVGVAGVCRKQVAIAAIRALREKRHAG